MTVSLQFFFNMNILHFEQFLTQSNLILGVVLGSDLFYNNGAQVILLQDHPQAGKKRSRTKKLVGGSFPSLLHKLKLIITKYK